jgi:hypothetical protein
MGELASSASRRACRRLVGRPLRHLGCWGQLVHSGPPRRPWRQSRPRNQKVVPRVVTFLSQAAKTHHSPTGCFRGVGPANGGYPRVLTVEGKRRSHTKTVDATARTTIDSMVMAIAGAIDPDTRNLTIRCASLWHFPQQGNNQRCSSAEKRLVKEAPSVRPVDVEPLAARAFYARPSARMPPAFSVANSFSSRNCRRVIGTWVDSGLMQRRRVWAGGRHETA